MDAVKFKEMTCTIAKDQPEYMPLPAYQDDRFTVSKWKLNWRERVRLLFSGTIYLMQMNFRQPLQPQLMRLDSPFVPAKPTQPVVNTDGPGRKKPRSNRLVN